jgi:hypothetical protein
VFLYRVIKGEVKDKMASEESSKGDASLTAEIGERGGEEW